MNRSTLPLLVFLFFGCLAYGADPVLVGRGFEIRDVMFPGSELRVRKAKGLTEPLTLRITTTYPHGTAGFRYDFHCVPMVAGKHDLTQFLETTNGEPAKGLTPLVIEATGVLPAGPVGELAPAPTVTIPRAGGYKEMIPVGIGAWAVAGIGTAWYLRRRKSGQQLTLNPPAPELGDQLKALLQRAIAEPLVARDLAELERLVLAYSRDQLGLSDATDPAVYRALRGNPKTALWLRTFEAWLHRPLTLPPKPEELRELLSEIP